MVDFEKQLKEQIKEMISNPKTVEEIAIVSYLKEQESMAASRKC